MRKIICLLTVIFLSGCTTNVNRMSVIVPEGVALSEARLQQSTVTRNVTGSDTAPILLFIPLGQPSFDEAVKRTLQNGHGQILTNALITDSSRWFILFGWNEIKITGNVINLQ